MSNTTTRRGFVKGAAVGAACVAGMGIAGVAGANEKAVSGEKDNPEFEMADMVDTYTHATDSMSKAVLEGEQFEAALQFLADSSHYLYINRATPYYGNYTLYPATGFDTDWRSPLNGRVYRGPYSDPITRSVLWLTTNPNGSANVSIGSYWGAIPPNTELAIENHELEGYEPSDKWQIVCYMAPGQTVENFIRNGRGSLAIDGALVSHYGLSEAWEGRNVLNVEVKLDHYIRREVAPQDYYDGLMPTTTTWLVGGVWSSVPGWGEDAGEDQYRSIEQFWGCATGDAAALNFTTDEERSAYIERANADANLLAALKGSLNYMYFDVMQIVNVTQEIGLDFEQPAGKVNGLDMDGDGLLDRYPEGEDQAGEVILQNAYGKDVYTLPDWAYDLDFNLGWWRALDGSIIDPDGNKIIGANPDGTYVLEGE
ncbi:MAG: hypothetical protein KHY83_05570 [Coriobacteriia bacterium]|nr:hypothetical protein [Coriobacteriia bacterium]MBS5478116.1 hypothetical protein [Coriobacteriia bacterium]